MRIHDIYDHRLLVLWILILANSVHIKSLIQKLSDHVRVIEQTVSLHSSFIHNNGVMVAQSSISGNVPFHSTSLSFLKSFFYFSTPFSYFCLLYSPLCILVLSRKMWYFMKLFFCLRIILIFLHMILCSYILFYLYLHLMQLIMWFNSSVSNNFKIHQFLIILSLYMHLMHIRLMHLLHLVPYLLYKRIFPHILECFHIFWSGYTSSFQAKTAS